MQALYAFNYQLSDKLKDELKARREVAKWRPFANLENSEKK
jgi:hypothetical protein